VNKIKKHSTYRILFSGDFGFNIGEYYFKIYSDTSKKDVAI